MALWCATPLATVRTTSSAAALLLEVIQADFQAYVNFFQPMQKRVEKRRDGEKIYKLYDQAKTPHQRAMSSATVSAACKLRLHHGYRQLNPAPLRWQIDDNLRRLRQLPE
jgi:hypothetical protein